MLGQGWGPAEGSAAALGSDRCSSDGAAPGRSRSPLRAGRSNWTPCSDSSPSQRRPEVALVADETLSGALSQRLASGGQEVEEGLAFVGLGPGQDEGDGQALKDAHQVQAQAQK